jgi:Xaa-Pro aminopeptidase
MTDGRYTEQAAKECYPGVEVFKWIDNKRYAVETYQYIMDVSGIKKIGYEENIISVAEFETVKKSLGEPLLIACSGIVETLRQQKSEDEITNLRTASEISDRALELTIPYIKPGVSELELAARLEFFLKSNGADNLSFDTLIISGARTSLLHGKPSNKPIEPGDLILFDFGALYKGYHADISRTLALGKATSEQKEVHGIIRKAQADAVASLKPGISCKVPDNAVREVIPEKYINHYYPGLGHGVGLQIHEEPFLGQAYDYTLAQNMTITIEPGIYIPGWGGIRIEDSVVIRETGAESLNHFPRDLMEL